MSDDVDALFGGRQPPRPTFTQRLGMAPAPAPTPAPTILAEPPVTLAEQTVGSGPYKPYGFLPASTVGESCEVRGWVLGTDTPQGIVFQYRFLMQVGYVGEEMLKLSFPDCIVVIEGKHLGDLRQKLSRRMASFIQQHHPRLWSMPPQGEPFVARIEVLRQAGNGGVKA